MDSELGGSPGVAGDSGDDEAVYLKGGGDLEAVGQVGGAPVARENLAEGLDPAPFDPSLLTDMGDDDVCCPADGCLERTCSHCWFLFTCFSCWVYSSLLRLAVLVDLVVTLIFFIQVATGDDFVRTEITNYSVRNSMILVVVVAVVRDILLFVCFAYQYQTLYSTFVTATTVTAFSVVFLGIKLAFCVGGSAVLPLTLFSLIACMTEYFLYHLVRRRRIRAPPPRRFAANPFKRRGAYAKLPNREAAEDGSSEAGLDTATEGVVAVDSKRSPPPADAGPPTGGGGRDRAASIPDGTSAQLLASPYSRFVEFEGVKIHYRISEGGSSANAGAEERKGGDGKGHDADGGARNPPAMIFMHGFGGSVFSWESVFPFLEKSCPSARLVAFDRPGFGLTSRPTAGNWEHNPYTQQYSLMLTFKLMDHLGIRVATLVGHGSGGGLAVLAAAMRPKRVRSVILVSPAIYTSGFPTFIQSLFRTRLGKSIVMDLVRSEMGELVLRRSYYDKNKITEAVLSNYKDLLKVENWDTALYEMTRVKPTVKVESRLSHVESPVGIIHGANDKLITFGESKRIHASLERHGQRSDLVRIDNCGHVPHQELPKTFAGAVRKLWEKYNTEIRTLHMEEPRVGSQ